MACLLMLLLLLTRLLLLLILPILMCLILLLLEVLLQTWQSCQVQDPLQQPSPGRSPNPHRVQALKPEHPRRPPSSCPALS
jgi:hypothetical protein